jgi:GLPGLI family protein
MKHLLIITICLLLIKGAAQAQDFITRGKIEFEVKQNSKKIFAERQPGMGWADGIPEFITSNRTLLFSGNESLYLSLEASRGGSDNSLYTNLDTRKTMTKQSFLSEAYLIEDSVRPIKWKIGNEMRKIAGFECRKAVGRYHDSMYVVAFYCPEIISQGGPEHFAGLPGMILGLAIPRLYTTWFATRVELAGADESKILSPTLKKGGQPYTKKALAEILYKSYMKAGFWPDLTPEKMYNTLDAYTF